MEDTRDGEEEEEEEEEEGMETSRWVPDFVSVYVALCCGVNS